MKLKLLAGLIVFNLAAVASASPDKVAVNFNKVYVAEGFDDNDNLQFVGEGRFASECYRHAETSVRVNEADKTIHVGPVAYKYDGLCLQLVLPFTRVIDVGLVKAGTYTIVQETDNTPLAQVEVKIATTKSPDDYLYAPISQAFFQNQNSVNKVTLTGDFSLSCMKLKEVKTHIQTDVLVILPIAEIDPNIKCVDGKYPFEITRDLGLIKTGRYLLHVRSMNGQAVNSLVDVP